MSKKGFTLIEVLVSMVIFALLLTGTTLTFANILKQNTRINLQRKLQEESNYLIEKIVKEIHNTSIDYASQHIDRNGYVCEGNDLECYEAYTNLAADDDSFSSVDPNGEDTIYLLSATGDTRTTIHFPSPEIQPDIGIVTMSKESYLGTNWEFDTGYSFDGLVGESAGELDFSNSISSKDIVVENLSFLISPTQDPHHFYELEKIQTQPTITITLTTHIESGLFPNGQSASITLQTTVSSRYYNTIKWATS